MPHFCHLSIDVVVITSQISPPEMLQGEHLAGRASVVFPVLGGREQLPEFPDKITISYPTLALWMVY